MEVNVGDEVWFVKKHPAGIEASTPENTVFYEVKERLGNLLDLGIRNEVGEMVWIEESYIAKKHPYMWLDETMDDIRAVNEETKAKRKK